MIPIISADEIILSYGTELPGRTMVVDSSAKVTCFVKVLLKANFAVDMIQAIVCATRYVAKYVVGATHNGATKMSLLVLCLHKRHMASEQVLKLPLINVLSNIAMTTKFH